MPDVGTCTSPRLLKRHAELFGTRKSTTPPSISMLGLPLELVTQILDATMVHPEEEQAAREQLEDPWSHGWRSPVKASTLATRTTKYQHQLLDLLLVCRTFYRHLLPKLWASPLLLTPSSIQAFTSLASQSPHIWPSHSHSTFGSLVTALSIQPLTTTPSQAILEAWLQHLPALLTHCTRLSSLSLGVATRSLSSSRLGTIVSAFPLHNTLETLSMLDLYAEPENDTRARQDAAISLISCAPSLRSISLSGMNLLEENHAHARDSGMHDVPVLDARESVLERFLGVLRLGGAGGGVRVQKLFMWQNTAMAVGGLAELLEALPGL